jgi:release factor glutamine methyltransferase
MENKDVWTIQRVLTWTTEHFSGKKISSARLDAEILLAQTLQCRRLDLYLKFDQPLKDTELKAYKELIRRRGEYEPIAYITGVKEFYSRPFLVDESVLIPRPETEMLVEEVVKWAKDKNNIVGLDIGTGSGCICTTLALEIPESKWTGVDISKEAIETATENSQRLNAAVEFSTSDYLDWKPAAAYSVITANPPYISEDEREDLAPDVRQYEPSEALFGGPVGTELIKAWLPKIHTELSPGGLLMMEMGITQWETTLKQAQEIGFAEAKILSDLTGRPRFLRAIKV